MHANFYQIFRGTIYDTNTRKVASRLLRVDKRNNGFEMLMTWWWKYTLFPWGICGTRWHSTDCSAWLHEWCCRYLSKSGSPKVEKFWGEARVLLSPASQLPPSPQHCALNGTEALGVSSIHVSKTCAFWQNFEDQTSWLSKIYDWVRAET